MEIRRIYTASFQQNNNMLLLDSATSTRIIKVLRLKKGNIIEIFRDKNSNYFAEIIEIKKGNVLVKLKEKIVCDEYYPEIRLAQSLLKSTRMDWLIEKIVEIGISEFYPLVSRYSLFPLPAMKNSRKISRWKKIMISAAEQSGKNSVPKINEIREFSRVLIDLQKEYDILFFCNKSKKALDISSIKVKNVLLEGNPVLFIGPEGGWSDDEIELAEDKKVIIAAFPSVTYRSETAAIAALSIVQYIKKAP